MEDSWVFIDDDDASSHCSLTDSDKVDSETEAELYSKIHYAGNLSETNDYSSENLNAQSSEFFIDSSVGETHVLCIDNRDKELTQTELNLAYNQTFQDINFQNNKRKSSDIDTDCSDMNSNFQKKTKRNVLHSGVSYLADSLKANLGNMKNKKRRIDSPSTKNCAKKNDTVVDSSDSDSEMQQIWAKTDSSEKSNFKINMLNDIDAIFLSSDTDDEITSCSTSMRRNSILKNMSMPNIKVGESSKDSWFINIDDMYRQKKNSRRYHETADILCSQCNKRGHFARTCPSPRIIKCFICGGQHLGARCSNRMCSNCYLPGHDSKRCWKRSSILVCHLCNMKGHTKENCPDLWRRYHLTTTSKKIKKGKELQQDTKIYCWNCGRRGHFGAVCTVIHPPQNFNTWPCVISYNKPDFLLKKRLGYRSENFESGRQQNCFSPVMDVPQANSDVCHPRNELNVSNNTKRRAKGGKKHLRVEGKKIIRDQDFPRKAKKKSPQKCDNSTPEVVSKSMAKRLRRKMKLQEKMQKKKFMKNKKYFDPKNILDWPKPTVLG